MKKKNLILAGLAFLMCLISVYFGASIYNANENFLVDHLNEMDNMNYYDVAAVPALSKLAAIITFPFIVIILVGELFVVVKSNNKPVKNIAIAISIAMLFLVGLAIATISFPLNFDFSHWGFFWVILGLVAFGGNMISVFVKGN